MRNDLNVKRCVALIGSTTRAMRAQQVLSSAAIRVEVIKADSAKSGRGCVYAIAYSCSQQANVCRILHDAGIHPRGFYEETL